MLFWKLPLTEAASKPKMIHAVKGHLRFLNQWRITHCMYIHDVKHFPYIYLASGYFVKWNFSKLKPFLGKWPVKS